MSVFTVTLVGGSHAEAKTDGLGIENNTAMNL
jgi:hypothetical protein